MRELVLLTKLMEECGELTHIASKVALYGIEHKKNKQKLKHEMLDVMAAISAVIVEYGINVKNMEKELHKHAHKLNECVDDILISNGCED